MSEIIIMEEPQSQAPYCVFVEALLGTMSRRYVIDTGGLSTDNLKHMAECLVRELRSRQEPEGPEFEDGPEFNGWEGREGRFQWREQMWLDDQVQPSIVANNVYGFAETENSA